MNVPAANLDLPSSPSIRFFLPILYLAWSDELLTPTEISEIERLMKKQDWLTQADQQWICEQLDPSSPPTPHQLKQWYREIRNSADSLEPKERRNLLMVSKRLAQTGSDPAIAWDQEGASVLTALEKVLQLHTEDALRTALESPISVPQAPLAERPVTNEAEKIREWLEKDQLPIKDLVLRFLTDPVFSYDRIPEQTQAYRELVYEWTQHLADQGWGSLAYPTYAGGQADMRSYITVFEALGHHDLSLLIKFGVQFGLFGGAVQQLGNETQKQAYLEQIGSLELPGCFAMTEADHGSNVRDLETTATYEPESDSFVIETPHERAYKEYIGNAATHGRMAVVFAQLYTRGECFGVHAFLVPIRDEKHQPMPGVTIGDSGHKLGLNGVDNGRLWFREVKIPRTNLLDRFGQVDENGSYHSPILSETKRFFTMLSTLVGGRICVPIGGLSAAKSGLEIAIRYALVRRQFGKAGEAERQIISYPSHQVRLMPLLASTYVFDIVQHRLADRFVREQNEGEISRETESLAAGIKALSTWHTTKTLQSCREACGGNGFLSVNRLGALKSDSDIFTTFEGDNTVLLQLVAKNRLGDFRENFGSLRLGGLIKYLGSEAARYLQEMNPIAVRQTDPDHLRDPGFHLSAFRYREEKMVMSAGQTMKELLDKGQDPYDAFLELQNDMIAMAEAYIERVLLEKFWAWMNALPEEPEKAWLAQAGHLFAVDKLHQHRGWYLEQGYFESAKSRALTQQRETLSAELSEQALTLVEAFGIPSSLTHAPIAKVT